MSALGKLNVGVVGAVGRGGSFRAAFDAHPVTRLHAVCDLREDELPFPFGKGILERLDQKPENGIGEVQAHPEGHHQREHAFYEPRT